MNQKLLAQSLNFYQEAASQDLPGVSGDLSNTSDGGFGPLLASILSAIMTIAALLVLLNLLWAGIEWITSGGDSGKVGKARDKITQSVIGIIVLAATTAIFMVLQSFLGIELLTFPGSSSSRTSSVSRNKTTTTQELDTTSQNSKTMNDTKNSIQLKDE